MKKNPRYKAEVVSFFFDSTKEWVEELKNLFPLRDDKTTYLGRITPGGVVYSLEECMIIADKLLYNDFINQLEYESIMRRIRGYYKEKENGAGKPPDGHSYSNE